jgi:hypothetical protein
MQTYDNFVKGKVDCATETGTRGAHGSASFLDLQKVSTKLKMLLFIMKVRAPRRAFCGTVGKSALIHYLFGVVCVKLRKYSICIKNSSAHKAGIGGGEILVRIGWQL